MRHYASSLLAEREFGGAGDDGRCYCFSETKYGAVAAQTRINYCNLRGIAVVVLLLLLFARGENSIGFNPLSRAARRIIKSFPGGKKKKKNGRENAYVRP